MRSQLSLLAMRKGINEEDFEPVDPNRICGVGDRYRSEYLTIYRDVDEQGQPIYDAEYYGYDEGDPEDPIAVRKETWWGGHRPQSALHDGACDLPGKVDNS